jgi:Family of unknown function (DUF6212)
LKIKFQIAVLTETHDEMDGLKDVDSIEWLRAKQTGECSFDFYKDDSILSSINLETGYFDLQLLLGIVVVGSAEAFEAIASAWNFRLPAMSIGFRRVPAWDPKAILSAGIECITDDLALQRRHSGTASLELATYRREFDRLQRCYTRLEEYVSRQSFPAATEVFEYSPDADIGPKKDRLVKFDGVFGAAGGSLAQYLPVDSFGISSFSIYIGARPAPSAKPLCVKLKAIETGNVIGTWLIDAADAGDGWLDLALNQAIDGSALSLVVVIEYPAEDGGWSVALGPPHPYQEFCASTSAGEYLSAPIALRIFRSLPGVRVAATLKAIRAVDAPIARTEFIPYEAYAAFVQVIPSLRDNKQTLVFYDRDIGCLTVHPRIGGLTVARLPVVFPKDAWGVSAQIYLAHEKASPTEFGIMVCAPRDEKKGLAALNRTDAPSLSFSGWKVLQPLETKTISVVFVAPPGERQSIYLLTRQAPESSPDFGWARFCKLEFQILPASLLTDASGRNVLHAVAMHSAPRNEELVSESELK